MRELYECVIITIVNRSHQIRLYPSSKMCSKCGNVKDELGLSERTYRCEACGNVLDRDLNAAINIRDEGFRIFTEGHSESACGGR